MPLLLPLFQLPFVIVLVVVVVVAPVLVRLLLSRLVFCVTWLGAFRSARMIC